jgi:hypothetical protein
MKKGEKTNNKEQEILNFELILFNSFKSYGYLFPKTIEDVERFEELYGTTEIQTPDFKKSIPNEFNLENIDFNFESSLAAFKGSENELSDFSDEGFEDDKNNSDT